MSSVTRRQPSGCADGSGYLPNEALASGAWAAARLTSAPTRTYGMMGGMEKTTVYLTGAQKLALERASRAEGRSEADLIREGIETVTARHRTAEPRIPLFKSGIPDLASRVDDYIEGFGEDR